jgi:hypothetical protein
MMIIISDIAAATPFHTSRLFAAAASISDDSPLFHIYLLQRFR